MKEILIYLMSISSFVYGGEVCDNYKIAYTTNVDTIIRVCKQEEFTNEVKLHELGHIFFYQVMTEEERQKWIDIHNKSLLGTGTLWQRGFINYECMENYNEDFTETFAYIFLNNRESVKIKFIKTLIKKYNLVLNKN